MENLNKIVYLPIEIKNRELYSKAILAAKLLQKNFKVIIGQQWFIVDQILKKNFPTGVYFQNSLNNIKYSQLKSFKELQFYNVLLDEENYGINFRYSDFYYNYIKSYYFNTVNKYYCNTTNELNTVKKIVKNEKIFLLTGNVRKEFLEKYSGILDSEVEELKIKYGKFILINTNYGTFNSNKGGFKEYYDSCIMDGFVNKDSEEDKINYDKIYFFEKQNFQNLLIFFKIALKKFNNINFIIRNHPLEDLKKFKEKTKNFLNYRNFIIDNSGSTHAFIMASSLLIHTSCTTGMEASYLNKPTINFIPSDLKWFVENFISFDLNKKIFSVNDLVSEIELFLDIKDYYKIDIKEKLISPSEIIAKDMENCCTKWNENFNMKMDKTYINHHLKNIKIGKINKEEVQRTIDFVFKKESIKKNYKIYELFDSAFLLY